MTTADVYLPRGNWHDFWDSKALPVTGGSSTKLTLHPGHVPVYVRQGSILFKKMRRRRSALAMAGDPYTVVVYGEKAKGRVYVDDGTSHEYQQGAFIYDEVEFD